MYTDLGYIVFLSVLSHAAWNDYRPFLFHLFLFFAFSCLPRFSFPLVFSATFFFFPIFSFYVFLSSSSSLLFFSLLLSSSSLFSPLCFPLFLFSFPLLLSSSSLFLFSLSYPLFFYSPSLSFFFATLPLPSFFLSALPSLLFPLPFFFLCYSFTSPSIRRSCPSPPFALSPDRALRVLFTCDVINFLIGPFLFSCV